MDCICDHAGVDLLPLLGVVGVGVGAGCLSGLLGVGGATASTPGVRLMGATPVQAVASTIPAVLPSAIVGAWRSARAGLVDWPIALVCGGLGSVAAVAGAYASDRIDPRMLMVLTAVVLLWSGLTVLNSKAAPEDDELPLSLLADADPDVVPVAPGGTATLVAPVPTLATAPVHDRRIITVAGLAAGLIAGLLGIGGGVVLMPLFTGGLKLPVKRAVPTSLAAVAIFSIPALVTHVALGHVDWAIAGALVLGSIPGARLGAHLHRIASDDAVRRLFGLFLVVLALGYGASEVDGLLAVIR